MYVIREWRQRYEVNEKGRPASPGDRLRSGPLLFIRSKVYGHSQSAGFAAMQRIAGGRAYEVFGVFQKLLEIAGQSDKDTRGVLLDHRGKPADNSDLAHMLRTKQDVVDYAMRILTDPDVEWVEEIDSRKIREFPEKAGRGNCGKLVDNSVTNCGKLVDNFSSPSSQNNERGQLRQVKNGAQVHEETGLTKEGQASSRKFPEKAGRFLNTNQYNTNQYNTNQTNTTPLDSLSTPDVDGAFFDRFWNAYPKKVAKATARERFEGLNVDSILLERMLAKIKLLTETEEWKSEGGRYIPNPVKWLEREGWEDEVPEPRKKRKTPQEIIDEYDAARARDNAKAKVTP